ncbi:MAG: choice-of-anchor D domain-containing protein [Acidobacteria bacterium]|nr:choice-of-anchor D domain-containing protein [Acidobacteriota bacterium]
MSLGILLAVTSGRAQAASGTLTSSQSALWYNTVTLGQSKTLTLTLKNTGNQAVRVSKIYTTNPVFKLPNTSVPFSLNAGASRQFSVTFTPTGTAWVDASLNIFSNASNPVVAVLLRGSGVKATNTTTLSLAASPASLSFGSLQTGSSKSLSVTLKNTGTGSVTISNATLSGSSFTLGGLSLPKTLSAGSSAAFTVTFSPKTGGSASGSIAITSNAPTVNIGLAGTGTTSTALSASPSALSFGSVQTGSSKSLYATLTNTGGSSVTVSKATVSGTGFTVSGLSLPATIQAGSSVTFSVGFAPKSAGSASGSIAITSTAPALTIALSGTGAATGQLAVTPSSLSFGTVTVGSTKSLTGTISASGSSVTVSSAGTSSAEWVLSGVSLPFTVAAGSSKSFTVTFKPQSSGSASGTASFVTSTGSTVSEALSGSGAASGSSTQHSVNLSWKAGSSSVVGYNIYRSTVSGGSYTKLNSALNTATSYVDKTVAAGTTYYYVATAVNSSGAESGYSAVVVAVVPTP